MSVTGLDRVREVLVDYLVEQGVHAAAGWDIQPARRHEVGIVAVTLDQTENATVGFRDYLGERYNEEQGYWEEWYGKQVKMTFGLHLYSPQTEGAAGCHKLFSQLADVLAVGGPEGIQLGTLRCGEVEAQAETGTFHALAQLEAAAWLCGSVAEDGSLILDFVVRGTLQN